MSVLLLMVFGLPMQRLYAQIKQLGLQDKLRGAGQCLPVDCLKG